MIDHAKEELANDPGNFQIKYHHLALINEVMVVAVDLGLLSGAEKEGYEQIANEELRLR